MAELPQGTVTLLFTDIEGSTRTLESLGDAYGETLEEHHRRIRDAVRQQGGVEVDVRGDGFFVAFERADDAVQAAANAQTALADLDGVRVRMGIHTGQPRPGGEGYVGLDVHRAARICEAAHGGQILVSQTTRDLVDGETRDLGEHRLKDLTRPQRLYQLVGPGLATDFPPPRTLENRPTNLPSFLTPLIGRDQEVARLTEFLGRDDIRIVTLTGPGGSGKTRLALQAAAELVEEFPDGVYFIALESVDDPELVLPTVAQTLAVNETGSRTLAEALSEFLRDKRLLLVIDNFEQLLDAAALVSDLATRAQAKLLLTSRAPLRVTGEHELQVPPLPADEAFTLFVERAQAVRADFAPTPEIGDICTRLDGLPLAIELAAARVRLLTPHAMLDRLDERLSLLTSGPRDLPSRQQTLRAAIDWSYDLLGEREQRLFAKLGVFAGGFRLDAAEAVCSARLDELESLLENNLVRQEERPDGEPRFSMLETIREYARERLDSNGGDEVVRKHAEFFLAWAEERYEARSSGDLLGSYAREAEEQENIRSALSWMRSSGERELELRLARAMVLFWFASGFLTEGRAMLESALAHGRTAPEPVRARAMVATAQLAWRQGDEGATERLAQDAVPILEQAKDDQTLAFAWNALAVAAQQRGDFKESKRRSDRAMALHEKHGNTTALAGELGNQGYVALVTGDYARGESLIRDSLELLDAESREYDFHQLNLGLALCRQGRHGDAAECFRDSLQGGLADRETRVFALEGLANVAAMSGEDLRAARLWSAADELFTQMDYPLPEAERELHEELVPAARARAGAQAFDDAWTEGRLLSEEQAVELALDDA